MTYRCENNRFAQYKLVSASHRHLLKWQNVLFCIIFLSIKKVSAVLYSYFTSIQINIKCSNWNLKINMHFWRKLFYPSKREYNSICLISGYQSHVPFATVIFPLWELWNCILPIIWQFYVNVMLSLVWKHECLNITKKKHK